MNKRRRAKAKRRRRFERLMQIERCIVFESPINQAALTAIRWKARKRLWT